MTETNVKKCAVLNTSPVRKGVPEKATGQAKYTGDITLPGMRYGQSCTARWRMPKNKYRNLQSEKFTGRESGINHQRSQQH